MALKETIRDLPRLLSQVGKYGWDLGVISIDRFCADIALEISSGSPVCSKRNLNEIPRLFRNKGRFMWPSEVDFTALSWFEIDSEISLRSWSFENDHKVNCRGCQAGLAWTHGLPK